MGLGESQCWEFSGCCGHRDPAAAPSLRTAEVIKELLSYFFSQDMENKIRSTLNEIYFGKTKDIVNGLR